MKRARVILLAAIGLAAISALAWLLLIGSPSPQGYESVKTRLFFRAAKGSGYLGFREARRYLYSKGIGSQRYDLMMAVDAGLVKRVRFANKHADVRAYQGIASLLENWAPTNGVQILSLGITGDGLVVLVLASEEPAVTNDLNSLAMNDLMPID